MRFLLTLIRDQRGGPAAEFAMVLPIAIMFLLGIIDVGRLMWTWNMAEKATQMGVRYAAVTDYIVPGIANQSFVGLSGLTTGRCGSGVGIRNYDLHKTFNCCHLHLHRHMSLGCFPDRGRRNAGPVHRDL